MEQNMQEYWESIPINEPITYDELCALWGMKKRAVRSVLHDLSLYDNQQKRNGLL